MEYVDRPLIFKLRKVGRYVRLYGPRRTLVKVRSQYHMRLPRSRAKLRRPGDPDAHVGVIGCGKFAYSTIGFNLARYRGAVLRGAMDKHPERAASLARRYRLHYATDDASRVIEDPSIDLVYIASNHASHTEYAVQALHSGKSVHIEKPHAVSEDQLLRLCQTMRDTSGRVMLGFNRPQSRLGREVERMLLLETGPTMFNWFVAGHEIPKDHWYFRPEEGGRVLGNLCHWTDFVLQMTPPESRYPIVIRPTSAHAPDAEIAVTFVFGDGSIAAITFSAKGHAFEGVREQLSVHRGDLLLSMTDFQELQAHHRERKRRIRLRFRDHGHRASILRSYDMSARGGGHEGASIAYVWETGELFLKTRQALETNSVITVEPFNPARMDSAIASA